MAATSELRAGDHLALKAASVLVLTSWTSILAKGFSTFGWFGLHPLFQSVALALFTYGILTLQATSQPATKAAGLARHQLAMLSAFFFLLLGSSSVWYNKELYGKPHYATWHGLMGPICATLLILQVLVGGGSVWFDGAVFGGGIKAKAVWKYHRLSGYSIFLLLFFTAHLGGAWSGWGNKNVGTLIRPLAYTIAPLVIVTSVFARIRSVSLMLIACMQN
ncbi:hypothetical protein JOM56_003703 [Amanita muscaria]